MTQLRKRRFSSHLKLLLVSSLVAIAIVAAKQFNVQELLRTSLIWVESLGSLGPIAFIVIYNLATVLFIPGTLLTMSGGVLFGVVWGSVYVAIAISGDSQADAQKSIQEWGIQNLTIGYEGSIDLFRSWGLYISKGAFEKEPPLFCEPGFFLVKPDGTLFYAAVNTELPKRLAVIGGGPIGCELAQAFQRLGSQIILFHNGSHVLNKEDKDAAEIVQNVLIREGIHLVLNSQIQSVEKTPEGKLINFLSNGSKMSVVVDEILVGAGRAPNVEGLNLEAVGVEYDQRKGVKVNDYLQTTNPKIYAAGDICMDWKFTHAADAAARIVIKNTLFSPFGLGRSKLSNLVMPWVTYTDPEIAHVGMYEQEAQEKGINVNTIKIPFSSVDRAIADGEEDGFVKILHKKGSDKILGATIVSRHAGETISEVTTAIVNKVGLNGLSSVIHPYPTQAEAIKKAADAYRRTLLTPTSKLFLGLLTKVS